MKKLFYPVAIFILSILLTACASILTSDIEVKTASDPKVNLKAYKTYAWLGRRTVINDPEKEKQPSKFKINNEIKFLIDRELRSKNYNEVAAENAEVAISFFSGVDMDAKGLKIDPKTKIEIPSDVPRAALVVVAQDKKTGYVVWMGVATGDFKQDETVETTKARLDFAITKMFNNKTSATQDD